MQSQSQIVDVEQRFHEASSKRIFKDLASKSDAEPCKLRKAG